MHKDKLKEEEGLFYHGKKIFVSPKKNPLSHINVNFMAPSTGQL